MLKAFQILTPKDIKNFWRKYFFKLDVVCYLYLLANPETNKFFFQKEKLCLEEYNEDICHTIKQFEEHEIACSWFFHIEEKPYSSEELDLTNNSCTFEADEFEAPKKLVELEYYNSDIGLECKDILENTTESIALHENNLCINCNRFSFVCESPITNKTSIKLTYDELYTACDSFNLMDASFHELEKRMLTQSPPCYDYAFCKFYFKFAFMEFFKIERDISIIGQAIIVLVAGGLIDRYKKFFKISLILPILCQFIFYIICLIGTFFTEKSNAVNWMLYFSVCLDEIFASKLLLLTTIYICLAKITPAEDRIWRFSIFSLGYAIFDRLYLEFDDSIAEFNYKVCFGVTAAFMLMLIFYIVYFIGELPVLITEDSSKNSETETQQQTEGNANDKEIDSEKLNNFNIVAVEPKMFFRDPQLQQSENGTDHSNFSFYRLFTIPFENITFLYTNYNGYESAMLCLLILASFLTVAPLSSAGDGWAPETFLVLRNRFSLLSFSVVIGSVIFLCILSKFFKCTDSTLGTITAWGVTIARAAYSVTDDYTYLFVASFVDMLVIKVVVSSIARPDDAGKIYGLLAVSERLCALYFPSVNEYFTEELFENDEKFKAFYNQILSFPNVIAFQLIQYLLNEATRKNKNTLNVPGILT